MNLKIEQAFDLFEQRDFSSARNLFQEILEESPSYCVQSSDTKEACLANIASCLAAEGNYTQAKDIMSTKIEKQDNLILYNRSLCNYRANNYEQSLDDLNAIIENCKKNYAELFVSNFELLLVEASGSNELVEMLQESCLIEALNLKSAIVYRLTGNGSEALELSQEIPIRSEDKLDSILLHNKAIFEHETDFAASIDKLTHLSELGLGNSDLKDYLIPPEVYRNMILFFLVSNDFQSASDYLKSNTEILKQSSPPELMKYFEIQVERRAETPADIVCLKLDRLLDQLVLRISQGDSEADDAVPSEDQRLLLEVGHMIVAERSQTLWQHRQFRVLEELLLKTEIIFERLNIDDEWRQNLAHVLFLMDTRFESCSKLYAELLPKNSGQPLHEVDPYVLANLCVAFVLTGRNGDAEQLIKDVELEEEEAEANQQAEIENGGLFSLPSEDKLSRVGQVSHSSIINLAIETLYCVKNNYEFGLNRMFKTLEPLERKLNGRVWLQFKRCVLSLLDNHCKQLIYIRDDLFNQLVMFLIRCERTCAKTNTVIARDKQSASLIRNEARYLRAILLTLVHD